MMPFQVWFKHDAPKTLGFSIRYTVPSGFGALQLRPSFVTSATAPSGQLHNLSAVDVVRSVLLYRAEDSAPSAWQQAALWDDGSPAPTRLPIGEWCLFTRHGQRLFPTRPLKGWPRPDAKATDSAAPGPFAGLQHLPVSAVRHLRRINQRLTEDNHLLRDRIAELERMLC
jgi:hypothetical protein